VRRDCLRILVLATALVALALGVPTSSAASAQLSEAAQPVVTHARDTGTGDLVAARPTEQRTRAPASRTMDTGTEPALVLGAILLAGFLLILLQASRPPRPSLRSLPWWRGPPPLAFTR